MIVHISRKLARSLIRPPTRRLAACWRAPPPATTVPPCVSLAERVMMLITPLKALAPQRVEAGPLITSMRSMSSGSRSCMSQYTPENSGV